MKCEGKKMIKLEEIESPKIEKDLTPILLTDETMNLRKNNLI